jgi:sporulation protein YlmC with PRC-barrel domain
MDSISLLRIIGAVSGLVSGLLGLPIIMKARREMKARRAQSEKGAVSEEVHASRLIGANIKDQAGEDLGKIKEIIIDPQSSQSKEVVISGGDFLGMGDKQVVIPWNQVKLAPGGDAVHVSMSKEEFKYAPPWEAPASRPGGCPEGPPCPPQRGK